MQVFRICLGTLLIFALTNCSMVSRGTDWILGSDEPEQAQVPADEAAQVEADASAALGQAAESPPVDQAPLESSQTSRVAIEKLPTEETRSTVEVFWRIPEEPTEGFQIEYGYAKERLDFKLELQSREIETYEHPEFGKVYRYEIKSLPSARTVYVSIRTRSAGRLSPPSGILSLKPEQNEVSKE